MHAMGFFNTPSLRLRIFILFLHIAVKPYFLEEPEDVTSLKGDDISLDCQVGGDPQPTVLWHREDGKLPLGRTSIQNGRLSIENVNPQDEGVYACEAQNTVGTISVSATLSVHGNINIHIFVLSMAPIIKLSFLLLQHIPIFWSNQRTKELV
jgi:hypothetical protein